MSSLTGPDAPILQLNTSASELAIVADRVKLFNVAQQRLSADITHSLSKGNSAEVYTCATWGTQQQSGRLLLLGTQAGEVQCYDTARAELRWSAAGSLNGAVASMSCSLDDATLIAVGRTGGAAVLDIATGAIAKKLPSKHQLSAVAALPNHLAVLAGSGVQLVDVAAGTRTHKFTGHANLVTAVAATPDGRFICTAAEGERHAVLWDATPSKSGKRKHKSAAAQLALDQPAAQLAVAATGGSGGSFHVVALTQGGSVWLFECTPAASGGGGSVETRVWGRSKARSGAVLAVGVEGADASGINLLLVTGSTARPAFQRLRVDKRQKAGDVAEFAVQEGQEGALLGQKAASGGAEAKASEGQGVKERAAPVVVLDPGAGAVLASKAGAKRAAEQDLDEDKAQAEQREGAEEEERDAAAAGGPTFGERLAALQLQDGAQQAAQQAKHGTTAAVPTGPIKVDSLSVLMGQALQSGDRVLLERCLTVRNEDVIRKTAARLGSADAALFLKAAVQRLQSAPARGEQLAAWIRAVLLAHAGSLVAMQGMQDTLGYLYQLIEARLASYHSFLALAGRLDVVLAHAQRATGAGTAALAAADAPLVMVEVGSDDAIEVEDAFAANGGFDSEEDGSEFDEEGLDVGLSGDEDDLIDGQEEIDSEEE